MSQLLDWGNGYQAGGSRSDDVRIISHSGLEYPGVGLATLENTIIDGGRVGLARGKMRRISVLMEFQTATRAEIAAAFSPGVERTLTGATTSLPYYVEDVLFPKVNLLGTVEATVVIVSPLAYPLGAQLSAVIEGSGGYDAGTTTSQTSHSADYSFGGAAITKCGQTFPMTAGQRLHTATVRGGALGVPYTPRMQVYRTSGGLPIGAPVMDVSLSPVPPNGNRTKTLDYVASMTGTYAVVVFADDDSDLRYAGGYVGGQMIVYNSSTGTWGAIAPNDLYFSVVIQDVEGGVGTVTFDADTDVPCPCVVSCTMVVLDTDIVITDGTRTATITGTLEAGDVVVIDTENHTITVNGTDRIAWFDRAGGWPQVSPGSNSFTVTPAAATSITWKPRRMGLL